MRHYLKIICKESNRNEVIDYLLDKYQVVINNEDGNILYNSDTYIVKGDDDNQNKEIQGQTTET